MNKKIFLCKLVLLMFLFSPSTTFSAEKESGFLSDFLTKFEMFRNVTGKLYTITTDVTSVIVNREYSGISKIGINSENIYLFSGKFTLLPDGLNLSLGYSTTTTGLLGSKSEEGKGSSSRESEYVETAFDVVKTAFGTVNLGYSKLRFNSVIKNNHSEKILVEDVPEYFMGSYYPLELKPGESYTTNASFYERYIFSYLLPENEYLYYGLGFNYAQEKGSKPHPYQTPDGSTYAYSDVKQKGSRIGLGYYRNFDDLDKGFAFKTIEIFQRKFTRDYSFYQGNSKDPSVTFDFEGKLSDPANGLTIEGVFQSNYEDYDYYLKGSLEYESQKYKGWLGPRVSEDTYVYVLGGGLSF